jgi:hypothetical protein
MGNSEVTVTVYPSASAHCCWAKLVCGRAANLKLRQTGYPMRTLCANKSPMILFGNIAFSLAPAAVALIIATVALRTLLIKNHDALVEDVETSDETIAITDVTVIDVITGMHRTGLTVLVLNDRIEAIAPTLNLPPGVTRVNGRGKFLIPGLWDMHTHHQATGADSLDLFVAKGVLGTRDMGGTQILSCPCVSASSQARFSVQKSLPLDPCWMTLRRVFPTAAE